MLHGASLRLASSATPAATLCRAHRFGRRRPGDTTEAPGFPAPLACHIIAGLLCGLGDVHGRVAADERLVVAYDVAVWNI